MAYNQHEKFEDAKRITKEIESTSIDVMNKMQNQTGQLKLLNKRALEVDNNINDSDNIMNNMFKREKRNKILILFFAFIILIIFIAFLLIKFQ